MIKNKFPTGCNIVFWNKGLSFNKWATSWENLILPYANNKLAAVDQPAHPRSLISVFVIRCLDSIIPLVSTMYIRNFNTLADLAIADLLIMWPFLMYLVELLEPSLSYNKYFCVSRTGIMLVSFTSSLFTLTHINFDRFMGIIFPLKHFVASKRKKLYYAILCFKWVISVSLCSSTRGAMYQYWCNRFWNECYDNMCYIHFNGN